MPGTLTDTYAAAVQHDLADLPPGTTLVGVVRRPTGWFHPVVDENHPALGPPDELLSAVQDAREELVADGVPEDEAHDAAWAETEFADRYRRYLREDPDARAAVSALVDRLQDGEDLALVCYENTDEKRCHRTILRERVAAALAER